MATLLERRSHHAEFTSKLKMNNKERTEISDVERTKDAHEDALIEERG